MIEGSIAFKIEVKELLSIANADTYLSAGKHITESFLLSMKEINNPQLQTLALPTSNDQPENFPFIVIQGEGTQLTVSRREILFTCILDRSMSLIDAAKMSVGLKSALFDNKEDEIAKGDNLRLIEGQFNNYIQKKSYTDVLKYLEEKQVLKDNFSIDSAGFLLRYSQSTDTTWIDHLRHEYLSTVNMDKKLLAIQASCAIILGGYSFEKFEYEDVDLAKVDLFTNKYTEQEIGVVLAEFYGTEEE